MVQDGGYYTLGEGVTISVRSLLGSEGVVSDPIKYILDQHH